MSGLAIGSREPLKGLTYTVGVGGNFSTLPDALTATRSLTTTLIASFTGSGTIDTRVITRASGDSIAAYVGQLVGVRIDNATTPAPIVLGWVETSTQVRLAYNLPITYTSKTIELYLITPVNLTFLPGTREVITSNLTLNTSFTTISALVPRTAMLQMASNTQMTLSITDNHIHFRGMRIAGDLQEAFIAGKVFGFTGTNNALAYLCDHSFVDVEGYAGHIDFMYMQAVTAGPSFRFDQCEMHGFYDVLNMGPQRNFQVKNSNFYVKCAAIADFASRCITFSVGGTALAYSSQQYIFENNSLFSDNTFGGTPTDCISFGDPIASNALVSVKNNYLHAVNTTGNISAHGLNITSTGGNTPTIIFEDNLCNIIASGTGTAYFARSSTANYVIREKNNRAVNGNAPTWGTNVIKSNEQDIAYAAAITPDLSLGDTVVVGTLTGNLTVNAPLNPTKGAHLILNYTADATPGRTITYNAAFKSSVVPVSTASAKASHHFIYDGTNWVQTGGALLWL